MQTREERLERLRLYRESHRKELRLKARAYYDSNKQDIHTRRTSEEARAKGRVRYQERREKELARAARYRETHRAEINARASQSYRDNPPTGDRLKRKKQAVKKWAERNRDWLNEYKRLYEAMHRDHINAQRRALYWANDKKRISTRRAANKAAKELRDHYVRYLLKMKDAPKELIEAKREQMKIRRLIRNEQAKH